MFFRAKNCSLKLFAPTQAITGQRGQILHWGMRLNNWVTFCTKQAYDQKMENQQIKIENGEQAFYRSELFSSPSLTKKICMNYVHRTFQCIGAHLFAFSVRIDEAHLKEKYAKFNHLCRRQVPTYLQCIFKQKCDNFSLIFLSLFKTYLLKAGKLIEKVSLVFLQHAKIFSL